MFCYKFQRIHPYVYIVKENNHAQDLFQAGLVLPAYLTAALDPLSPRLSSSSKMGLVTPAHRLLVKFKDKLEFKRIVHCRHSLSVQGYV